MDEKFVVKSKDPDAESMLFERKPNEPVSMFTRSLPEDEMGEEEEDNKRLVKELVGSTTPPPVPLREEGTPGDDNLTGKSKLEVCAVSGVAVQAPDHIYAPGPDAMLLSIPVQHSHTFLHRRKPKRLLSVTNVE